MFRCPQGTGHVRFNRIEINIGHTGEQVGFIQQGARIKAHLKQVSGALIFMIDPYGKGLFKMLHKARQ